MRIVLLKAMSFGKASCSKISRGERATRSVQWYRDPADPKRASQHTAQDRPREDT